MKIVDGPFAGMDAELVSADGDTLTAQVTVFGRPTTVELHRDQVERPEDIPELWSSDLTKLREQVAARYDDLGYEEKFAFFLGRVDLPEEDPAQEWDAYTALCAEVDARMRQRRAAALRAFDQGIAALPAAREERRSRYSRLDAERAHRRRAAARSAAELRDYAVWRAANRPQGQRAAVARVERERAAVEERVERDWGFRLPGSIFRFRAFLLSLGPIEKRALDDLELVPYGIMDLFDDPARGARPGVDVRVHGRYYRDPPEFLTFMHGGTDGLHFGLWYDDGRTCTGVASYYNNDGGGVGLPSGTPLETVRNALEWGWRHVGDWDDEPADPPDPEVVERRHRLRLLRETLMTFETGDRDEHGEDYHNACGQPEHEDRIETLDGGGALADGDTVIERGRQRPWDDYDFCTALRKELTDPAARGARVAEARQRCAAGQPADALTLGRDLHWISAGDPERERQANELLTLAYRALGRDNLAAIAQAHHRHRDLPQVHVLEGT
ncbi:Uncharacterised conserved protein [Nonomuraea solani]|uniref:Uncharacterized conserved protein n=1 Tax=Nonomuraea solani TaxID=1144553 RepID=A0A1H6DWP2_9ACTN|nr:DUF2228 domain-containing protein [Nonomuraea solani]SEG89005.1 Uncharacterised conserved protein [Nonomuraea solani]